MSVTVREHWEGSREPGAIGPKQYTDAELCELDENGDLSFMLAGFESSYRFKRAEQRMAACDAQGKFREGTWPSSRH